MGHFRFFLLFSRHQASGPPVAAIMDRHVYPAPTRHQASGIRGRGMRISRCARNDPPVGDGFPVPPNPARTRDQGSGAVGAAIGRPRDVPAHRICCRDEPCSSGLRSKQSDAAAADPAAYRISNRFRMSEPGRICLRQIVRPRRTGRARLVPTSVLFRFAYGFPIPCYRAPII